MAGRFLTMSLQRPLRANLGFASSAVTLAGPGGPKKGGRSRLSVVVQHPLPKSPVRGLCEVSAIRYHVGMTISPMQLRLAAAYPSTTTATTTAATATTTATATALRAGATPADVASSAAAARTEVVDRLELSPTARMQQRIRDALLAGRVDRSILADEPTAGETRATLSAIAMHRSAAAANAAATGVAAGTTFDASA